MKKIIPIFLLIFIGITLFGCNQNKPRIEELEKRITELQDKLSQKEEVIEKLQQENNKLLQESTESTETSEGKETQNEKPSADEKAILDTINNYITAVEEQNFDEQKKYVAKYALDLVNFKEFEYRNINPSLATRIFNKQEPKIVSINDNKAEGYMSFTENQKSIIDGREYELVTEGKVLLEKINSLWKIIDYTRKNHLISEALYSFDNLEQISSNVTIKISYVLFSLQDKTVNVSYSIDNNNDFKISTNAYSSTIVGPDKIQNEQTDSTGDLSEIYPNAVAIASIGYNWTNSATGNFKIYFGDINRAEDYNTIIKDIVFNVTLFESIRY